MGRIAPVPTATQADIDEFGEVDRQLRLWVPQINPFQARYDELEAKFLSGCADLLNAESRVVTGRRYQVEVTARGFQRPFTAAAQLVAYKLLKKIQGLDLMRFFSVTQAEAKAHLGQAFLDTHVPKLQTGPRQVNVVALVSAAVAKKVA